MTTKEKNEELNRLQGELRKLKEQLEERVKERTAALMAEVAQHRQAEAAIRASEEKYHSLVDNLPIGTGVTTLDGRVIERNITAQRLFGYESKEEFMSLPVQTLYYDPEDRRRLVELAKKGPVKDFEMRFRRKDGTFFWGSITMTMQITASGEPQLISTLQDITERKRAEEEIRLRAQLLDVATDSIFLRDFDSGANAKFLYANEAACKTLRYTKDEFMNMSMRDLTVWSDTELVESRRRNLVETGENFFESTHRHKDGKEIPVEVRSSLVKTGDKRYILTVARDITERKKAEEEIQLRAQLLDAATESILLREFDNDVPGNLVYINEAAYKSRGYTREERMKMGLWELNTLQDATLLERRSKELIEKGDVRYEEAQRCKDGSTIPVEMHVSIIRLGGRKYRLAVAHNITERKEAEAEIQQSLARLQRSVEQVIQTMALIAEVRDPYTAGHQLRVAQLSFAMAEELGLPDKQVEGIRMAAFIHDIGKIHVPSEILSKPGRLTEPEFSLLKTHSQVGYDILKTIEFPWPIAQTVLEHHERLNGSGYPAGLTGDKTSFEAKILAVADVVEAMSSHRPYRPALGITQALEEIDKNKGILYDPEVAGACMRLFNGKGFKFEQ